MNRQQAIAEIQAYIEILANLPEGEEMPHDGRKMRESRRARYIQENKDVIDAINGMAEDDFSRFYGTRSVESFFFASIYDGRIA